MAIAVRQCSATNKAGGPCGVPPLKDSEFCNVHDPDSPVASKFAPGHPPHPGAGRPRLIRSIERMQQLEDEKAEELARVHLAVALDPDAEPQLRMRAVEYIHDRLAGKTTQRTETEHSVDGLASFIQQLSSLNDTDGDQ